MRTKRQRKFIVPEVVQTSGMDCGPASLTALLHGFNIPADYGRLREACHTDVDGTSINTLEDITVQLGLNGEQIVVPADHLLLPETEALPAIVVVRLPNGFTHFVLLWNQHGPLLQIMDPASGRRWISREEFLADLYEHRMNVPASAWREYAGEQEFSGGLTTRIKALGIPQETATALLSSALLDNSWHSIAVLDAATRMIQTITDSGGLRSGREAGNLLRGLYQRETANTPENRNSDPAENQMIPEHFWSVRPVPDAPDQELEMRGAVLIRIPGTNPAAVHREQDDSHSGDSPAQAIIDQKSLPKDLAGALHTEPQRPLRFLLQHMRADGIVALPVILLGLLAGGGGVLLEALLFRGLFDAAETLALPAQRIGGIGMVIALLLLFMILEVPLAALLYRFGRMLENNLLLAFMEKIPRLSDRYFQSRPVSDMADRSHTLHLLRGLPLYGGELIRLTGQFLLTTLAILWIAPGSAPILLPGAAVILLLPFALEPFLAERDMRMRTHRGGLSRFYLDSMIGSVPIRVHGAQESIHREHANLLREWERAGHDLYRAIVPATALQILAGTSLVIALLFTHISNEGIAGSILLLSYWTLQLPLLGERIGSLVQQYPSYRSVTLRLLEPLGTPEETAAPETTEKDTPKEDAAPCKGVHITIRDVSVHAAGNTILEGIDLNINPGEHIAIVGHSGAGKSTLAGLLLGWHVPSSGTLLVNGQALTSEGHARLRSATVWIDPAVHLWKSSLFENLLYGNTSESQARIGEAITDAQLESFLERLPDGMMTQLGEGGNILSGGEGQRVRLGRGLLRSAPELVILDEPFRGLDRETRNRLLSRAREIWADATLLCISHDIEVTRKFDRVLVVEDGHLVEDGNPADLASRPGSRYRSLLETDLAADARIWPASRWKRTRMQNGRIETTEEMRET